MTSSVLSVDAVSVAYERMNDWPAHWSVLIRTPVIVTRVDVPLNDFLSIATVVTVPGFRYTLPWMLTPTARLGTREAECRCQARAGVDLRFVGDDAATDLLTGLHGPAGQLGAAATGDLSGERSCDKVFARRNGGGQRCDGKLGLVGTHHLEVPAVGSVQDTWRGGRYPAFRWQRVAGIYRRDRLIRRRAGGGGGWAAARGAAPTGIAMQTVASTANRLNMVCRCLSWLESKVCNGFITALSRRSL